jgi:hypothetical protein
MKINAAYIAILLITTLLSCDIVEGPYAKKKGGTSDTTEQVVRKILIEDFTGHQCGNCPRAAEALKAIEELYPGQIVSLGVHVGFFAEPSSSGNYTADYRSETGNELDQYFGNSVPGLPNGLINRILFDNNPIVQYTDWSSKAAQLLTLPPDAWIEINPEYNATARTLQVNASVDILTTIEDSLHLALYLSEDSIVSAQKDYSLTPSTIPAYTHRHVLRGSMNGTWGLPLATGTSFAAGSTFSSNASYTLPANWNENNVHVVAILFKANSKEVVQAEDVKIIY